MDSYLGSKTTFFFKEEKEEKAKKEWYLSAGMDLYMLLRSDC